MAENEPKCVTCENVVADYTPEFMKQMSRDFRENKRYQVFINDYNKNTNLFHSKCMKCRKLEWQGINPNYSQLRRSGPSSQRTVADTHKKKSSDTKNYTYFFFAMIVAVLIGYNIQSFSSYFNGPSKINSGSIMMSLKDRFPSLHQGLKKKLNGAFSRLQTPGEPIVFMLLHDDVNKMSTDCLVTHMIVSAKEYIFTNSPNGLWINGSDWTGYSDPNHEELLYEKLISDLKVNEVLVVENLQDLPWSLAKLLHHLCDSENPTITRAMYMLELRVNGDLQQLSDGDKIVAAEMAMNAAWLDAPNEFRAALIARLTSYVDTALWKSDSACLDETFIKIKPET